MNIPIITDVFAFLMKTIMQLIEGVNGANFVLAILLFTVIVKVLLFPLQYKSKKGMIDQQRIAPKMQKLEKKYGNNKQKYQEEVNKLYKEEGVSLMGGCLPSLLTLVIILGLYTVIYRPMTHLMKIEKNSGMILAISQDLIEMKNDGTYLLDGMDRRAYEAQGKAEEYDAELAKLFQEGTAKGFITVVEAGNETAVNQLKVARLLYGNIDGLNAKLAAEKAAAEAKGETWTAPYATDSFFEIDFELFGLDLGDQPSYNPLNILVILPILSCITAFLQTWVSQFYQKKITAPKGKNAQQGSGVMGNAEQTSKTMMYMMPIMSLVIGFMLPAGITVYWVLNNLLSSAQEPILMALCKKNCDLSYMTSATAKAVVLEPVEVRESENEDSDNDESGND